MTANELSYPEQCPMFRRVNSIIEFYKPTEKWIEFDNLDYEAKKYACICAACYFRNSHPPECEQVVPGLRPATSQNEVKARAWEKFSFEIILDIKEGYALEPIVRSTAINNNGVKPVFGFKIRKL